MIKIGRRGSLTGQLIIMVCKVMLLTLKGQIIHQLLIVKILNELKDIKFDKGTKDFQPTNLEVTKININNTADNVIPGSAEATFNIRFNNKHSSSSIKKRLNKIFSKI